MSIATQAANAMEFEKRACEEFETYDPFLIAVQEADRLWSLAVLDVDFAAQEAKDVVAKVSSPARKTGAAHFLLVLDTE